MPSASVALVPGSHLFKAKEPWPRGHKQVTRKQPLPLATEDDVVVRAMAWRPHSFKRQLARFATVQFQRFRELECLIRLKCPPNNCSVPFNGESFCRNREQRRGSATGSIGVRTAAWKTESGAPAPASSGTCHEAYLASTEAIDRARRPLHQSVSEVEPHSRRDLRGGALLAHG